MTGQSWQAPPRSRGRVGIALALIFVPLPLAPFLLVLGLFGSLFWVYLSIAITVIWLPSVVVGVLLLRRPKSAWIFMPPPGWPPAPGGWTPPPGWQPDPAWPQPPADWTWWERPAVGR